MHPALTGGDGRPPIAGEVVLPGQAASVVLPEGIDGDLGLEDVGIEEIPTPRIRIRHRHGVYKDSQTGVETPVFNAIILGLVKQRVMFSKVVKGDADDVPQCKSVNYQLGMPNVDPQSRNLFPWADSPWNPNEVSIDPGTGRVLLQCTACPFKDWTGPYGNQEPPACNEVWNLVIMYDPYGNGQAQPAFLAIKKTGLKNVRAHIAKYKQSKTPMFVDVVQFSLEEQIRGDNAYQMPVINVIGQTDPSAYLSYAENFKALRGFITTIRPAEGADQGVQSHFDGPEWEQATTQPPTPAAPAQQPQAPAPQPQQAVAATQAPTPAPAPVPTPQPQAPSTPAPAPQVQISDLVSPTPPQVPAPAPTPAPAPAPVPVATPVAASAPAPAAPSFPQAPAPSVPGVPGVPSVPAPMPTVQAPQTPAPSPEPPNALDAAMPAGGAAPWAAGTPGDDEDLPF